MTWVFAVLLVSDVGWGSSFSIFCRSFRISFSLQLVHHDDAADAPSTLSSWFPLARIFPPYFLIAGPAAHANSWNLSLSETL